MRRLIGLTLLAGGVVALGSLVWRYAARRRALPCPSWLSWLLENRYVDAVAGSATLLERAGVAPGMRVLDAGCGFGRLTIPAAERVGPTGEVVALDLQQAMLDRLRGRLEQGSFANVRVVQGGLGEGLLERDRFDRALLVTVLGEVPDRERALREIHAALVPGGVLSVTEVLPDPHYQSLDTARRLAGAAGFRVERVYGHALAFTANLRKPVAP